MTETIDDVNNILITGGGGFIGIPLAQCLHSKGFSITIIDDFSRGSKHNIHDFPSDIEVIEKNILQEKITENAIQNADLVFHLSALSRVIPSINDPELCFRSNVVGTEIIARICSKYKKKIIFSSSREIYGNAEKIPVKESFPLVPENPYGSSKIAGESIIRAYSRTYGLKYDILRLTNVYGPLDFDRVIPIFIERAMNGEIFFIYGGEQVIDFVYIDDVIDAFIGCLDSTTDNKILNIGSGIGTDIISLAKTIIDISSSSSKFFLKEKRTGEVDRFVADISNAKKMLNWKPKIPLKNGLDSIVSSYQKKKY
jgi:UDP-glucose 4-epimerase